MKIKEIKDQLLAAGFQESEFAGLKKGELEDMLNGAENATSVLETAVEVLETAIPAKVAEIDCTDPKWTEHVLKEFTQDELENGNPKVDGLRRVAEKLLGRFCSRTEVLQCPTLDNGATVVVSLEFLLDNSIYPWVVEGAADVSMVNTDRKFAIHSVATAETRAEGRALRRALKLVKVLAAEELHNAEADEPNGSDSRIPSSMINGLKVMADKQKLDLDRLADFKFKVSSVQDLTLAQGRQLSTAIFKFSRGEEEIPEDVKAF